MATKRTLLGMTLLALVALTVLSLNLATAPGADGRGVLPRWQPPRALGTAGLETPS
jgi:hypothetical protein